MSAGIRLAGWGYLSLGLVVTAGLVASMTRSGDFGDAPGLVIPALFAAAGAGLLRLAHLMRADENFGIEHAAKWIFLAVGGVMIAAGAIMAFQNPAGLFLMVMGAVFAGAGWLAGTLFVTPETKVRVFAEDTTLAANIPLEGKRTVRSGAFVEVDVDATAEERQAAVDAWRADMLALRPDWTSGRIRPNAAKAGRIWVIPLVIVLIGCGLVGVGLSEARVLVFVGTGAILLGLFLLFAFVMRLRRSRVFGATILALERTPLAPGERLEGVLEIPAPLALFADGRFTLTLSCSGNARSEGGSERTTYTVTELWNEGKTAQASGAAALRVKVMFDLPGDLPGATLTHFAAAQTRWSLTAEAKGAAMDFREDFDLPILEPAGGA